MAFVFIATLVAGLYFVNRDLGKTSEEERLEVLTGRRREESEGKTLIKGGDLLKETASSTSSLIGQLGKKFTGLGTYLEQGDCKITPDKFLLIVLAGLPNLDLKFFVTAVAIQKQSGGDLAEILDKISYVIRERFKILGTVAALTAEGCCSFSPAFSWCWSARRR